MSPASAHPCPKQFWRHLCTIQYANVWPGHIISRGRVSQKCTRPLSFPPRSPHTRYHTLLTVKWTLIKIADDFSILYFRAIYIPVRSKNSWRPPVSVLSYLQSRALDYITGQGCHWTLKWSDQLKCEATIEGNELVSEVRDCKPYGATILARNIVQNTARKMMDTCHKQHTLVQCCQ